MFELVDSIQQSAVIKVIGVGGGGGNAVKHMIANNVDGVEFICANTDAQALKDIDARTVLQLGNSMTKGLGAGANPEVGRQAALEDRERIAEVLRGADMVFIAAGMGGGTGTGGAPVVAEVARDLGILTVAVVTKPFPFDTFHRVSAVITFVGSPRAVVFLAKEELFNLRFQVATNQLDNTARLKTVKKDIARILTVMRERDIEVESSAGATTSAAGAGKESA